MKFVTLILLAFSTKAAAAELNLFCARGETPASCSRLTTAAAEKIGCVISKEKTNCHYTLKEDPKNPGSTVPSDSAYCELESRNCSAPMLGNFGGETCLNRKKVKLAAADRVHNGYWFGWFSSYSRTLCKDF